MLDYDPSQSWPDGSEDSGDAPIKSTPSRIALSGMFGSTDKRVYRVD